MSGDVGGVKLATGWGVCVCLSACVCTGGDILAPVQSLSTGACWTQHLVFFFPPCLAFSFHLTVLSFIFFFLEKYQSEGVILPSNINFSLIKDGLKFKKNTSSPSL